MTLTNLSANQVNVKNVMVTVKEDVTILASVTILYKTVMKVVALALVLGLTSASNAGVVLHEHR